MKTTNHRPSTRSACPVARKSALQAAAQNPQPGLTDLAIVGLGYVGLPLALQFARSGVSVLGLDIDPVKVNAVNRGQSYIKHIRSEAIAS